MSLLALPTGTGFALLLMLGKVHTSLDMDVLKVGGEEDGIWT